MKKKVLVTYNMLRGGYAQLEEEFDVVYPADGVESFTYEEVLEMIPNFEVLQPMFNFKVDKKLLDAATKLEIISNYAVGFDNIDVDYATQKGIQVTNTPETVTEPTADLAMGLIVDVTRRVSEIDRKLRQNQVKVGLLANLGDSIYGATLGIVGFGRIGQALARRAVAAGMKIVYYSRNRVDSAIEKLYNATYLSFEELLATSDVVSVNTPLSDSTRHLFSDEQFGMMKKSSYIVNTARGAIIDEFALIKALQDVEIKGAALDVFEFGDYPTDALKSMDNVVIVPHIGTQTVQVRNDMAAYVSQNIINFYSGEGKVSKVNVIVK